MAGKLALHQAAVYQIRFQGVLDESWVKYLNPDLTINTHGDTPQALITTLTGKVSDQAALLGLLNSLYYLGLPLLSVNVIV